MTATDMESIIAAGLASHACEVVYYIGGAGHVSCHGCDGNWASFAGFHAHQARAVLAAISEAGAVEWGVEADSKAGTALVRCRSEVVARQEQATFVSMEARVVSRVTFPWERAE